MSDEPFANPVAPANHHHQAEPAQSQRQVQPLTNEDFRKLITTPRPGGGAASATSRSRTESARSKRSHPSRNRKPILSQDAGSRRKDGETDGSVDETGGKKKDQSKSLKQKENDVLSELAQRYRDRAKERRDGANPDYVSNGDLVQSSSGANVAPDPKSRSDFAERRKQLIEESKFLGGDMAHTHLVKGLDYALLHKVKAELQQDQELEDDDDGDDGGEDVIAIRETEIDRRNRTQAQKPDAADGSDEFDVKSRMAVSIVNLLNQKLFQRNDLFLPSRMAYLVDLENEAADDIPITVIRSRSECPALDAVLSLSTNDIVINKLAHIISSHRSGVSREEREASASSSAGQSKAHRKKADFEEDMTSESSSRKSAGREAKTYKPRAVVSIFDDLDDDYEPVRSKKRCSD